jgi:hypothetical protein
VSSLDSTIRHTALSQFNLCITASQALSDRQRDVAHATLPGWEVEDRDGMRAGGHRRMSWDSTRRTTRSGPIASVTGASTRANCTSHSYARCWVPRSRSLRWPRDCGVVAADCEAHAWKRAIGVRPAMGGSGVQESWLGFAEGLRPAVPRKTNRARGWRSLRAVAAGERAAMACGARPVQSRDRVSGAGFADGRAGGDASEVAKAAGPGS